MKLPECRSLVMIAGLAGMTLAWTPAPAQQAKTASGVVVNLGVVPAAVALRADGPPAGGSATPKWWSR